MQKKYISFSFNVQRDDINIIALKKYVCFSTVQGNVCVYKMMTMIE